MNNRRVRVKVPATTANLGPGFDCLGLSLNLWNEAVFSQESVGLVFEMEGEDGQVLPRDERNLIYRAMKTFFAARGLTPPTGLKISCQNRIPLGSGMGSSASAVLLGLLGGVGLCGESANPDEILTMAAEMEGHADNAAAALLGGLVIVAAGEDGWLARRVEIPPLTVAMVVPAVDLPTRQARAALPVQVSMKDATFNLGRTALVIEALRNGDLTLLEQVMQDRLHEPFRFALIPGAEAARNAARKAGAAVALSGAGPSLIAFSHGDSAAIANLMVRSFRAAGVRARGFPLKITLSGASCSLEED